MPYNRKPSRFKTRTNREIAPRLHPDLLPASKRNQGLPLMDPSQKSGTVRIIMQAGVPAQNFKVTQAFPNEQRTLQAASGKPAVSPPVIENLGALGGTQGKRPSAEQAVSVRTRDEA